MHVYFNLVGFARNDFTAVHIEYGILLFGQAV